MIKKPEILKSGWDHNPRVFIGKQAGCNLISGSNHVYFGCPANVEIAIKEPVKNQICDICKKPISRCHAKIIGRKHRDNERK